MQVEDLQLVSRTVTANSLLKHFLSRQRISPDTALDALKSYLIRQKVEVNKDDFYKFFGELEEAGVGELQEYLGNKRGRFVWYYSLRDVSEQILNPNKKIEIRSMDQTEVLNKRKSRGRPVGYSPKVPLKNVLVEGKRPPSFVQDNVIFLFTTDAGEPVTLKLAEAERLVKQIGLFKSKLG